MAAQDYYGVVQQLYVAYFGRPADHYGLQNYAAQLDALKAPTDFTELNAAVQANANSGLAKLVQSFDASSESAALYGTSVADPISAGKFVLAIYQNVLNRAPDNEGFDFWVNALTSGNLAKANAAAAIAQGALANTSAQGLIDAATVQNKVAVATSFTEALDTPEEWLAFSGDQAAATARGLLSGVDNTTDLTAEQAAIDDTIAHLSVTQGKTFTLTTGADTPIGTNGDDTFNAVESGSGGTAMATLSVGDVLNGGTGSDTLNITQSGAFAAPLSTTIKGIETINIVSGTTGSVVDSTGWTGTTSLNVVAPGAVTATAAGTTAINLTDAAATAVTVNGGSNVTVTDTATTAGSTVKVGLSTAATGDVVVNSTSTVQEAAGASTLTGSAISVTGGKTITVNATLNGSGGSDNAGDTITGGVITVKGSADTTAVTVTQTAAAGQSADNGTPAVVDGQVIVADKNATSSSAANTLTDVTVNSFGASSTVDSVALKNLTLSGKGTSLNVNGNVTASSGLSDTLNLNLKGLTTTGTVTVTGSNFQTINIVGSGDTSTLAGLTATVKNLVVSGDKAVNLTQTLTGLTSVVSTNSAGLKLTNTLGDISFTSGAGNDTISIANNFSKVIDLGAGNDFVTYNGAAKADSAGSVNGGDGTDTIALTGAQAATVSGDSGFNSTFKGFEVVDIAAGAGTTFDLAGINGANAVVTRGVTGTMNANGFSSGGTLTLDGASTGTIAVGVDRAGLNSNDVFNVKLTNGTSAAIAFGTVSLTGIETVNINTNDTGSNNDKAATQDSLTLQATSATKVVVTGHNGLDLTNTGNTKITSFDASGVTSDDSKDTSANLGVKFASENTTANANVSIIGGDGNDVLTGNAGVDTITGGKGNDILTGGANADKLFVGTGHDIVVINTSTDATAGAFTDSSVAAFDVVNGFKTVSNAIAGVDFTGNADFIANKAGNDDLTLLNINAKVDDAGAGSGTPLAITVEADATGNGQTIGTTYKVDHGILTLSGTGASTVDTLGEWVAEAAAIASTNGEAIAFQFGNDTYVFVQNGTADVLVELVGVNGASGLQHTSASTTAAAGAILIG